MTREYDLSNINKRDAIKGKENSNKIMIASHTSIRGANSNWSNPNKVAILILVILVLLFTSFIRIV